MRRFMLASTGALFYLFSMWTVACGALTGVLRDNNEYDSPAEQMLPWSMGATAFFGLALLVLAIRGNRKRE